MTPVNDTSHDQTTTSLFCDRDLLKDMIQTAVQGVLDDEIGRFLAAAPYERTDARRGRRNGTKPRTLKTRVGEIQLRAPQARTEPGQEPFRPSVYERWQRSERALVAAMQEMVVQGVSTRRVGAILEEMGGFEVSAATVSRAMKELDEQIAAFFSRPLHGSRFPFMIIDARYEKVRVGGRVRSQAVLIAAGIADDGRRELLALALGDSESAETWGELFQGLKRRGLAGVDLVVSDAHSGIRQAMAKHLQGAAWQRCKVHLMREMLGKVASKHRAELAKDLCAIYASEERAMCVETARDVIEKWSDRAPKMARALATGVEDTLTVWGLEPRVRRRLNSTNMLERTMKEIKAITRKVGSFPNASSCFRLIGAVLLEMQDRWDESPSRYLVFERADSLCCEAPAPTPFLEEPAS